MHLLPLPLLFVVPWSSNLSYKLCTDICVQYYHVLEFHQAHICVSWYLLFNIFCKIKEVLRYIEKKRRPVREFFYIIFVRYLDKFIYLSFFLICFSFPLPKQFPCYCFIFFVYPRNLLVNGYESVLLSTF